MFEKHFTLAFQILSILYIPYLISSPVFASPPLFPEEDTGLGLLNKIFDAGKQSLKPPKTTLVENRTLEAKHYYIDAVINLDDSEDTNKHFTAPSSIKILVSCIETTNVISLNAYMKDSVLAINRETIKIVNDETREEIPIADYNVLEAEEIFLMTLDKPLESGKNYLISMEYTCGILDHVKYLDGLYRSYYMENGKKKFIAVTQFQAEGARKMFPCIDQPDDKAYFTISIGRMAKYNSMSNMAIVKTEPMEGSPGWYWDRFDTTPLMSTYLIAIVVSEYECSTAPPEMYRGKDVKVCAPPEQIANGGGIYGAETQAKLLTFYEKYLAQEYPLSKMVSASINQFAAGAMENWGLNTYRPSALLKFDKETTEAQREGITSIIAHELGHQWFGNMVTCKTWNQLWLNEGFATYIQYIGVGAVNPEFGSQTSWFTDAFQRALIADQKSKTHPLVNTTEDFGHFDVITYQKGASLIYMLADILTPNTLHTGLQRYLQDNAYGNTEQWDLFSCLEEEARLQGTYPGMNLSQIMNTWTLNAGFPVISVRKGPSTGYYISQSRFIADSQRSLVEDENEVNLDTASQSWWVNVHPVTSYDPDFSYRRSTVWLSPEYATLLWPAKKESDWMVLKAGSVYGRVLYDDVISSNLARDLKLNYTAIGPMNRAQLIDDYFTFSYTNYDGISIEKALQFCDYLAQEDERIVWTAVMSQLRAPFTILSSNEESFTLFKNYFRPRFSGGLKNIDSEEVRGKNAILKVNLLHWLVAFEDDEALDYSSKLVNEWMNQADYKENNIQVDYRAIVYCGAVANGNKETFDFIWERSQEASKENSVLLMALACATEEELITNLLNKLTELPKLSASIVIRKLAENTGARKLTFDYLHNNFQDIYNYFGDLNLFSTFVSTVSRSWSQAEDIQKLNHFSDTYSEKLKPMEKILNSSKVTIEKNMQWMRTFKPQMDQWFQTALNLKK